MIDSKRRHGAINQWVCYGGYNDVVCGQFGHEVTGHVIAFVQLLIDVARAIRTAGTNIPYNPTGKGCGSHFNGDRNQETLSTRYGKL